ncbi:MAG TPA: ATP-dependent DNA helicase RecG [Firmicutes bacterium]|nr:ATP-dependent DNA helicase RecG [Bacillota bacterium]
MDTPLRYLKGVGERRAAQFERLGVGTVGALVRHIPRAYEDWSRLTPLVNAPFGEACCVKATALEAPAEHRVRKGMTLYRFRAGDGSAVMQVTLFNNKYAAARIRAGEEYLFFGPVGGNFTRREMASPLIEPAEGGERIRPIYRQTEGLSTRVIEGCVARALEALGTALDDDPLPAELRLRHSLCTRRFALENIHFPTGSEALAVARKRLVFEELLVLQLGLLRLKGRARSASAAVMAHDYTAEFYSLLPFSPTGAQRRAIADCVGDLRGASPMSRLIQGDVGSGKTAVAAGVAFTAIKNGWQAALMAPTEILAEQHARSLSALLAPGDVHVGLLTGSQSAGEKREVLERLADGRTDLIVGTHALLSEGVRFARLGLVITDEQHRFGVGQRAGLAAKGINPHLLVMSATPIPRTLALIIYGDLDVSVLDELPPGRQPVETYAVRSSKRERAYNYVKKHIDEGRQAYIVCPLVEEGEGETDLASAAEYAQKLAGGPLKGYSLGLLHGRMKPAEKERTMAAFARNEISVLVSTTVIEVGVDVPNAVIMVIENAERFGLAQLHQLRGRVGRGQHKSTCILISDAQNEEAVRRLRVMCVTNDGFQIADEDLKLRGPGDFFGSRQHGLPALKIADLNGDMPLLLEAQTEARALIASDPELEQAEHLPLAEEVRRLFDQVTEQGLN